jgi:hypothetical protein
LIGAATLQEYKVGAPNACTGYQRVARLTWTNGPQVSHRLPADAPLLVLAKTTRYFGMSAATFENAIQFTPLKDHTYRVSQDTVVLEACALHAVDQATRAPPPDLVRIGPDFCKYK